MKYYKEILDSIKVAVLIVMSENKNFITVSCDGTNLKEDYKDNEQNSKHPLIYLKVPLNSKLNCPYCGREFFNKNV